MLSWFSFIFATLSGQCNTQETSCTGFYQVPGFHHVKTSIEEHTVYESEPHAMVNMVIFAYSQYFCSNLLKSKLGAFLCILKIFFYLDN